MKKRFLFMAVILCLALVTNSATSAKAVTVTCDTYDGKNIEAQDYSRYASPIESYLTQCDDGSLMRVQFLNSTDGVLVEYYDASYNLLSSRKIAPELPIFGGFYETGDSYFLLTGQTNTEESADVEVFRITKYDKKWNRLGSDGLYDCNTTVPFDAGSARFAVCGKYLLIRTAHEMYTSSDGYNHQANVTIQVDMDTVTITDSYTRVMNNQYGYVSHSFNQFIQIENNQIVAVDHGDAYPRSAVLIQYATDVSTGTFTPSYSKKCTVTDLMVYPGAVGQNVTGASIGGFEISDSAYLVAGNSVVQDDDNLTRSTRNIYVIAMDKSTSAVTTNWITSFEEGDTTTRTPHLVKIADNSYILLWSRGNMVYYTKVDGNGNQVGDIYSMSGSLSDCVPIVSGSKLIWYTWNYDTNVFYDINLNQLDDTHITSITNGHSYENHGVTDGVATLYCTRCGETNTISVPTSVSVWWNYEGGSGYYYSGLRTRTVGEDLYWWFTYSPSGVDDSNMVLEVSDPSMVTIEPSRQDGTMGKMTMLKSGSLTIKVYPRYNPDICKTFTLQIDPLLVNLTYDANGGSNAPEAHTIPAGECFELSTQIPVREGYTFSGWYTQASGGTKVTADTVFMEDTTIYAQWEKAKPSKVTGVTAVYENGAIVLNWDHNGAEMYQVVRTDGKSGYTNLTYRATAEGWTDTVSLVDAQLYYYRVIGYFRDDEGNLVKGDMSDAVGVVATDHLPNKIENVTAAVSSNKVTLTWDKADGARYYKVARAAGATGTYYCRKYNIEASTYSESSVAAGLYRYKIVGYYKDVDGSWVYGDMCDTIYVTVK